MTLGIAVLLGLGAYRLARVVVIDLIAEPVRRRIYGRAVAGGKFARFLHELTSCTHCLSVWTSFAVAGVWVWAAGWPGLPEFAIIGLGAAGTASILAALDSWASR